MRLLILLHDAHGGYGGIAQFNKNLLNALAALPQVSEIVVLRRHRGQTEPLPAKLRYVRLAENGPVGFILSALHQRLFGGRFDAVISGHLNLLPAALLARRTAPLSLILHGIDAWQPTARPTVDRNIGKCQQVIAVSALTKQRFQQWSGVPDSAFCLLFNAVDLEKFKPGPVNPRLRQRYGLEGKRVIMTLARLAADEQYKGFDEMLTVMQRLAPSHPDLVYLVAGKGSGKARLAAKARDLGVAGQVVFTGYVAEAEKVDLYRLAQGFVLCSRGEGFGIVLLEAMACGLPVLASLLDGSREAVQDGRLGLLADPDDLDGLTAAVETLLSRPVGQRPAGLEDFSLRSFNRQAQEVLEDLLARAR